MRDMFLMFFSLILINTNFINEQCSAEGSKAVENDLEASAYIHLREILSAAYVEVSGFSQ